MYKIIFSLIITLLLLVTILISLIKPQMHKTVFVYDSSYQIVEAKTEVKTTKTMPTQTTKPTQVKTVKSTVDNTTIKKQAETKKTIATAPKKTTTVKKQQVTTTTLPKQQTTKEVKQTPTTVTIKTISETERIRQETILWNKWRSDLQNQIMMDTKLPMVPQGTIFKFSFDVDKYGKITNLQTWSTNPTYTPDAIQHIAPVIKSYQGRSILNFPSGSNRISTSVDGGWKISTTSKYSTSNDYNDTERVSK